MTEKEYLDLNGLSLYDQNIKDLIEKLKLEIEDNKINWDKLGSNE